MTAPSKLAAWAGRLREHCAAVDEYDDGMVDPLFRIMDDKARDLAALLEAAERLRVAAARFAAVQHSREEYQRNWDALREALEGVG